MKYIVKHNYSKWAFPHQNALYVKGLGALLPFQVQ